MKFYKNILLYLLALLILAFGACKKNDDGVPPVISLKTGSIYTQTGTVVEVGGKLLFGIIARGTDANLTNLTVKKHLPDGDIITVMDTGLNAAALEINKTFYQGIDDTAEWVFTVMDRNRLTNSRSIIIYKDPNSSFGGIHYYKDIVMGFQENSEYGHFLDPFSAEVYFEDSATMFQEKMDILVYYIVDEDLPSPVFSSPGEIDHYSIEAKQFYPSIVGWSTRSYTLWDISVDDDPVPVEDFNNCHNDSLLIVAYDEVWGKKKFKWATAGRIIPFMTGTGKKGLIKVNNAEYSNSGTISFDIKIQQ